MNIKPLSLLFAACLAFTLSSPAFGAQVTHDGQAYQVVDYETLYATGGFEGWTFLTEGPSVFNGIKVVTVGWFRGPCYAESDVLIPPVFHWAQAANPGFLRTYWGKMAHGRLETAQNACRAYFKSHPPPTAEESEGLYLVFGTVRNGSGGYVGDCNNNAGNYPYEGVRKCLHIDVDDVVFQDTFRTKDQFWGETKRDLLKEGGKHLLAELLRRMGG
ncbi:MAG: hypothetical protein WDN01_06065 [Rhizomicrobium sp.]